MSNNSSNQNTLVLVDKYAFNSQEREFKNVKVIKISLNNEKNYNKLKDTGTFDFSTITSQDKENYYEFKRLLLKNHNKFDPKHLIDQPITYNSNNINILTTEKLLNKLENINKLDNIFEKINKINVSSPIDPHIDIFIRQIINNNLHKIKNGYKLNIYDNIFIDVSETTEVSINSTSSKIYKEVSYKIVYNDRTDVDNETDKIELKYNSYYYDISFEQLNKYINKLKEESIENTNTQSYNTPSHNTSIYNNTIITSNTLDKIFNTSNTSNNSNKTFINLINNNFNDSTSDINNKLYIKLLHNLKDTFSIVLN